MEPGGVAGGRGRGGLRGARSEEFLDRGHLEQDLRRPSTRSDLTYHIILWSPVEPFNYLCFTINPCNPSYRTPPDVAVRSCVCGQNVWPHMGH